MLRLSARNGGTVSIVKLERSPNESAAKSNQVFFSHVSRYLRYRDHFKDVVFLMQGVDIGVSDEYDRPVGNGAWDIYAQLGEGEDRFDIHYWAVHKGTRNGNQDAIAYTSIPKYSTFVHFSPCGQKFLTMDISDKVELHKFKVSTSFYRTDIRGKRKWDSHNIIEP